MTSDKSKNYKYQGLKTYLLEKIQNNQITSGEKVESEPELVQRFKLSRNTVRQAISELEKEGYLQRIRGKGTFVRHDSPLSSRKIGLIIFDIVYVTHPVTSELMRGAGETLQENGFILDVLATARREIDESIGELARTYAGFLIAAYQIEPQAVRVMQEKNIPHIFVKNYPENVEGVMMSLNYAAAGWQAVQHLAGLGHKKLALLCGDSSYPSARDFRKGVSEGCLEFGCQLKQSHVREVALNGEGAEAAVEALVKEKERPSAIITMEDTVAAVVVKDLEKYGLSVPVDCSVTGCNNLPLASLVTPALTTFALPVFELGRTAAEKLIGILQKGEKPESVDFTPELIIRGSTAACKQS